MPWEGVVLEGAYVALYCVIRVCIQVQGFEAARCQFGRVQHYSGLINCIVTVFRNEGMLGFFKGTQPTILKVSRGFFTLRRIWVTLST